MSVCVCVFLIDYPKINENRSRAHVRVYGFKFYKTRPVLERMCIAQAKQSKKKNTCNTWWVRMPTGSAAIKESCLLDI